MTTAEKIKQQRKLANLSMEDFGELIGVSLKTVQRWEKGERSPRMKDINRIAKELNIPASELMDSPENENAPQVQVIPSQNKTSQSQEINTGMAVMTLQDGRKIEVPATPEGYAFLTNLFNISEHRAVTA